MACNHTEGPGHNCAYVDARNALIPEAEAEADLFERVRSPGRPSMADDARWGGAFLRAMERLSRRKGETISVGSSPDGFAWMGGGV
jgi:hypothetical protein